MTTASTDKPDVAATLARLEEAFAANPGDVLGNKIADARSALATIGDGKPKLAELMKWRAFQDRWRQACCDKLFGLTPPIRTATARALYHNFGWSIKTLDGRDAVLA